MTGMRTFEGGCHCGNVTLRFETARAPADFSVRSCGCSFCRSHGTRTVSDPAGRVRVTVRDPARLNRYRFGMNLTDFLVCRDCGVYLGAAQHDGGASWVLVNSRVLAARDEFGQDATPTNHDAETAEARSARRKTTWTPATFEPPLPTG
jgi:hypothetical protein